jgi:predicted type IV restriction endonuclease
MDFKESILQFASRVDKICPQIKTEEATKNALIMPFIQLLGYDVFNPFEVNPEFVADLGIKKGEKVDYAIIKDDKPIILIECKHYSQDLNPHNSQLFRYFHTTEAKFGLLTNGVNFRFYTDLVTPNKMDEKPFFEFKITEIKDNDIAELKKFTKDEFNIENISNTASDLKYLNSIKNLIGNEITNPSEDFVKYFAKKVYPGLITQKLLDQFTIITRRAFNQLISESINDRLKTALKTESDISEPLTDQIQKNADAVVTTEDEKEAFHVIKSILRQTIKVERIVMRDAQSYCAILLDDNNRKPVCRLYLDGKKKFLEIPAGNKTFAKKEIVCVDDIYGLADDLLNSEFVLLAN